MKKILQEYAERELTGWFRENRPEIIRLLEEQDEHRGMVMNSISDIDDVERENFKFVFEFRFGKKQTEWERNEERYCFQMQVLEGGKFYLFLQRSDSGLSILGWQDEFTLLFEQSGLNDEFQKTHFQNDFIVGFVFKN